jgi:CheY-like chemotaxis protein
MAVMDGWQFLEQWKRDPRFANVPVVALSAHGALPDQPPQGAVAVLRKPFDLEVLLYVIKQHLKAGEDRLLTT